MEMKKEDKCLDKTIKYYYKITSELHNQIFISFKLIYLNYLITNGRTGINLKKDEFVKLKESLKTIIDSNFVRFKQLDFGTNDAINISNTSSFINQSLIDNSLNLENQYIDIETELRSFFKTCGNNLTDQEMKIIIRMCHLMKFEEKLTNKQIYQLWAIFIEFQKKKPEEILENVIRNYLEEYFETQQEAFEVKNVELTKGKAQEMIDRYAEFFDQTLIIHLKQEIEMLPIVFTVKEFMDKILIPRRYHPN
jgi:hypothetical protein